MVGTDRWAINDAEVAAKVIDGEAIILNLSTGMYYSLDGVGAEAWDMISNQVELGRVVSTLRDSYPEGVDSVAADLEKLIADLVEEQLIVPANGTSPASSWTPPERKASAGYKAPALIKHTDMADLLALDPPMPGLMDGPWTDSTEA